MTTSGSVTPPSDEALAGDTAQGFRGQGATDTRIFGQHTDAGKRDTAHPAGVAWLADLQAMAARFSGLGIGPDLAALTLAEAWGLYRFLADVACDAQWQGVRNG